MIIRIKEFIKSILPVNNNFIRYLYYPRFREWAASQKTKVIFFENRYKMYDYVHNEVLKKKEFIYLEFGVYMGASLKYWADLNINMKTKFYGFDTFTGLPESWNEGDKVAHTKGSFDAMGELPNINDSRVSFIKGLFQETLPGFLKSTTINQQLIIHNDSDLYSSSLYLLTKCDEIIKPGTIIIFDELSSWMNEFKALEEYCESYNRKYQVLASTNKFVEVAIIIL